MIISVVLISANIENPNIQCASSSSSFHISFYFSFYLCNVMERVHKIKSYFAHTCKTCTGVFRSFLCLNNYFSSSLSSSTAICPSFISFLSFTPFCLFFPPLSRATFCSPSLPPPSPLPHFCPAQATTLTHMVRITYEEKVSEISLIIIKHYAYYSLCAHIYTARRWSLFPACII